MLIPQVDRLPPDRHARRGRDRDRRRPHVHRDAAEEGRRREVRRVLRRRRRAPRGRRPRDDREHGARVRRDDRLLPVDDETITYLKLSGRDDGRVALAKAYYEAQGLYRTAGCREPEFTDVLELDLGSVVPSLAGPEAAAGPRRRSPA